VIWAESSAAPTFGQIMKFLLEYYKVPPTEDPSVSPLAKMASLAWPPNQAAIQSVSTVQSISVTDSKKRSDKKNKDGIKIITSGD
jgi:hypothetical protein